MTEGQAITASPLTERHDDLAGPITGIFVYVNWNGSIEVEASRLADIGQPDPSDIVDKFDDWSGFLSSRFVPTTAPLYVTHNSLFYSLSGSSERPVSDAIEVAQ